MYTQYPCTDAERANEWTNIGVPCYLGQLK